MSTSFEPGCARARRRVREPAARRAGFSLIELLMVVTMTGIMVAITASRFRISELTETQLAGMQLVQDIDFTRTRALAARSVARVKFIDSSEPAYEGYLDADQDSVIAETAEESQLLHGFGHRELPTRIRYGRGSAPPIPNDATNSVISFPGSHVDFNSRGVVHPMGTSGVVYLQHTVKPSVVVAVQVSAAGNVRLWTYKNGSWQ